MDCFLRSRLGWKESISYLDTLQGRGSSCDDGAVEMELTDCLPEVN